MAPSSASTSRFAATRLLPAAAFATLAALPAAATSLRVDVTGTLDWSYVYEVAMDTATGDLLPAGVLKPGDVPPGSPGFDDRDLAEAATGRFFYSPEAGMFSGCTGLMTFICRFNLADPDVTADIAVDATLGSFTAALAILPDIATFDIGPQSFVYVTDYAYPDPTMRNVTYFQAFPLFEGTIESMTLTVVPLPAALPMLLAGLGALALHRRRALPRPGQTRQRPSA